MSDAPIMLFVEVLEDTKNKVIIASEHLAKLGVKNGDTIEVVNLEKKKTTTAIVEGSDAILDFAGKFSKDVCDKVEFMGVELGVRAKSVLGTTIEIEPSAKPAGKVTQPKPSIEMPISEDVKPPKIDISLSSQKPQPIAPQPQPSVPPPPKTMPTPPPPRPTPAAPLPQPTPAPTPPQPQAPSYAPPQIKPTIPQPQAPSYAPPQPQAPSYAPPQPQAPGITPHSDLATTQPGMAPEITPAVPYPSQVDINMLRTQKQGIIVTPRITIDLEGRIQISQTNLNSLGLGVGMLIAWEDPLTRAVGSARISPGIGVSDSEILMDAGTKEDTNIVSEQIVIYSTEPPIQRVEEISLEVGGKPDLGGYCQVSPRVMHSLSIQPEDILAFEDELTGAVGAAKVSINEAMPDNQIVIDSEILEASGIGSYEVVVRKNTRQIIPLQSISLGINPIRGENMWEVISAVRQNVASLKTWLTNYVIFKGIKLRWKAANIACSVLSCVPDLTGDIFAQITPNTMLTLSPTGLVPFNAILIIDISRSMMARDVEITNIAPAIEGIKAAMYSPEIQEFLSKFKEGISVPRRIAAAFAAVLFLSEKVGRGFGEKVSVIRFADEAQVLPFQGGIYMDSASGEKGILEDCARMIVDRIGNAYGQATNMGSSMLVAQEILFNFEQINPDQPTMIVILTDGVPTDGNNFFEAIKQFSENPNVVIYIVGLGNPDDELMTRAASLCGGEYFKPENAGDLLIWYSKRARDLTVKLKAHK
jgi:hypothetical protein